MAKNKRPIGVNLDLYNEVRNELRKNPRYQHVTVARLVHWLLVDWLIKARYDK